MGIYLIDRITKEGEDGLFLPGTTVQVTVPYKIGADLSVKCECGFFLETNYKLTDCFCPNPYCFKSNSYKVIKVFEKAHESLNIGQKIAEDIILHNQFHRHMDLFTISDPYTQFPSSYSYERRVKWVEGIREFTRNRTFAEFIEYFQLDNIGSAKCSYLFSGINSVDELEKALDTGGVYRMHISKILGYASSESDATWSVYQTLKDHLNVFKAYEPYFTPFKSREGVVMFIALTGNFSEFRPKSKFIDWLRDNYYINPILVRYSSKANVLLYEEVNYSSQFNRAVSDGKAMFIEDFIKSIENLRREQDE